MTTKKPSAGSVFDAAVGDYGAILDVTMRPQDRREVLYVLSSQWRDWAETKTGNALKLQTFGGGRTIDDVVKRFTVGIEVLILRGPNDRDIAQVKRIMAPFWRYDRYVFGHYRGPVFTARATSAVKTKRREAVR